MKLKLNVLCAALIVGAAVNANADTLLDTGTPNNSGFPLTLDSVDYAATKFQVNGNYSIQDISGYLTTGNSGDTFTIALYSDNNGHVGTELQSTQATFVADGWNGASSLNWNVSSGNYWVAFEVSDNDSLTNDSFNLLLPLGAPNPALATAFKSGATYQVYSGYDYGVRVTAAPAVPVPAAAWLFVSGIGGLAGVARARRHR